MLRPTSARCKPSLRGNQVFSDESLLIRHFLVDVGLSTDLIAILVLKDQVVPRPLFFNWFR